MRGSILAAAAAVLAGNANAAGHRHAHELFHNKRGGSTGEVCKPECTTIYSTITGEATWKPNPPPPTPTYTPATVPTPIPQTCPTPGTYTFPATTVVVTETTTVCAASTTKVPTGTHTLGGVTTVVTTATTVTCPYATTTTNTKGKVTSVIKTTTYVCPSAGTYTIAPITITVTKTNTVVVVPVVTTYYPGTYTAPAVVTTVTETDVVVYCPFTSPTPSPSPSAYPTSKPSSSPAEYPAQKPSDKPASKPPTGGLGSGKHPAITYTPYDSNGGCKSASAVMADLKELKDKEFSTVRVYSTDCDGLPNIGAACEAYGMKMIIGVFIGKPGCDNGNPDVATQIAAISAWAKWSLVEMIIVGNEAGHGGFCTGSQLASLIKHVKDIAVAGGSNAPVTTADTVDVWQNPAFSGPLCAVVDVVGVQAHPYFNAMVSPDIAGEFVKGQLEIVKAICGKPGYVTETGWPSSCKANGLAVCGPNEQATAMKSIVGACGSESILFSMFDDLWKEEGECYCEKSWGIYNLLGSL